MPFIAEWLLRCSLIGDAVVNIFPDVYDVVCIFLNLFGRQFSFSLLFPILFVVWSFCRQSKAMGHRFSLSLCTSGPSLISSDLVSAMVINNSLQNSLHISMQALCWIWPHARNYFKGRNGIPVTLLDCEFLHSHKIGQMVIRMCNVW